MATKGKAPKREKGIVELFERANPFKGTDERLNKLFAQTKGFVEASSYERMKLWEEARFNEEGMGVLLTLGTIADLPVCVSFSFGFLYGQTFCIWDATSRAVDFTMVENWMAKYFPDAYRTDAMNFHNLKNELKRLSEKAA